MSRLPTFRQGMKLGSLRARDLQAIVDTVRRADAITVGPGLQHTRTRTGHNIRLSPTVDVLDEAGISVTRYMIETVNDEDYDCRTWDGANLGGSVIKVARDVELRTSTYDGKTVTWSMPAQIGDRTITYSYNSPIDRGALVLDGTSIGQTITPPYKTFNEAEKDGTEIYAVESPEGGTGVDGVEWVEIPTARAWTEMDS